MVFDMQHTDEVIYKAIELAREGKPMIINAKSLEGFTIEIFENRLGSLHSSIQYNFESGGSIEII